MRGQMDLFVVALPGDSPRASEAPTHEVPASVAQILKEMGYLPIERLVHEKKNDQSWSRQKDIQEFCEQDSR